MLLTVKSTLMIIFVGVTLNYPSIKSGKALIYASFHESKHQYFVSFHESKNHDFGSLHESKYQEIGNIDDTILYKIKCIVSHEGLYFAPHPNDLGINLWLNGG